MFRFSKKAILILAFGWVINPGENLGWPSGSPVYGQSVRELHLDAIGYYSHQQWDDSIDAFNMLIKKFPNHSESLEAHFFLAEALMQVERYQDAYLAYQKFLLTQPVDDLKSRSLFRMGEAAFRQDDDQNAISLLESFFKENPDHELLEYALPYLAEIRLRRLEPQLAQQVFERSLEQHPTGELANRSRFGLARSLHLQGYLAEALRLYRFVAAADDSQLAGRAELQIAQIYLSENEYESAKEHLENALLALSDSSLQAEATYWLARVYAEEEDYVVAFDLLDVIKEDPLKDSLASAIFLDLAQIAAKLGRTEVCLQNIKQLIQRLPQAREIESALLLQIDVCLRSEQHQSDFENAVNQYLESYPDSSHRIEVLEKAGRYYFDRKTYEKAAPWFQRLVELGNREHTNPHPELPRWEYLDALNSIGLGDFQSAESSLTRIDIFGLSNELQPLAQIALATARFGLKKYNAAIPAYQNFLKLADADDANVDLLTIKRARRELTICLAEAEMWSEAAESFSDLVSQFGSSDEVLEIAEYLVDRAYRSEVTTKAIAFLEYLLAEAPASEKEPNYLSALGWIRMEQNEIELADECFTMLVKKYPRHPLTHPAAMSLGSRYEEAGHFSKAIEFYSIILDNEDQPFTDSSRLAQLRLAYLLQKLGDQQNLQKARGLLEQFLEQNSQRSDADEAYYQLGWVLLDLGEEEKAVDVFTNLLQTFPNSKYRDDTNLRVAQLELKQGLLQQARQRVELLQPQADLPSNLQLQVAYLAGEIAVQQRRWSEVESLTKVLTTQTDRPDIAQRATYWLAESQFRQNRFELAIESFESLIEQWNDQNRVGIDRATAPWIWLRAAQAAGKTNQWQRANRWATEGLQNFPSFGPRHEFEFIQARALEDAGLLSDAREVYQSIIDSTGGSNETAAKAQWRIGETFFHQEDYKQAIRAYYRVDTGYSFETWRSAALLQAGKCQEHLDNAPQATRLYQRLIEQFPNSPLVAEAQQRLSRLNPPRVTEQQSQPIRK